MAATRPLMVLLGLIFLAGGMLLQFLTVLSGGVKSFPENLIYFLEAGTNGIAGAPNPSAGPTSRSAALMATATMRTAERRLPRSHSTRLRTSILAPLSKDNSIRPAPCLRSISLRYSSPPSRSSLVSWRFVRVSDPTSQA